MGQALPLVKLTCELPEALGSIKAAPTALTPLYLHTFEVAASPSSGPGTAGTSPAFSFGLLLPKALPVDDLPPFRVMLPPCKERSGPLRSPAESWGWAQVRRPQQSPSDSPTPLLLSAAEIKCLAACQDCYSTIIQDAVHPNPEPWTMDKAAEDRLSAWRSLMGLTALQEAVAGLPGGLPKNKPPASNQQDTAMPQQRHIWFMVPLTSGHQGQEVIIDWGSIRAMASGGAPLPCLPEWPAGKSSPRLPSPVSSTSPVELPTLYSALSTHVQDHGVVIAMHSGKIHVAGELQPGLDPDSPFPDGQATSFAEYYRR